MKMTSGFNKAEYELAYYKKHKKKIQARRKERLTETVRGCLSVMFQNSKIRARQCGMFWDLTLDGLVELYEKQNGLCTLSGVPLELTGGQLSNKISLDRIDSSKGYEFSNVQLVALKVNYMKRNMPEPDFISLCRQIADYSYAS